jgi:tetratricopeptide (TPR) repeat protein
MGPARDWLHKALELGTSQRSPERAAALRAVASLTRNSGQYAEAKALGEQSLALYRELGDAAGHASALVGLCITNLALEHLETALAQGQQAIDSAEQLGNPRILGTALNVTGAVLRCLGRRTEAEELFSRSRDIWVATDDRRALAGTLNNLALLAQQNHLPDKSRELALQALRLYRDLDLTEGLIDILELVALLELDDGHPAAALRIFTIAATQRVRIGAPLFIPDELAARDRAAAEARRLLGPEAHTIATTAQYEPIGPAVDSLLA